jgi:hypothetical protein
VKKAETIMEILAAYDLTHSYRDAAALVGCAPNTVARYVQAREAGGLRATPVQRNQVVDAFREKIEEWVETSHGRIRADVAQRKLEAMGYTGSERTTRRAIAEAKVTYELGTVGSSGHGYRNQACGTSGITPTVQWSTVARRGCGVRGWRGAAFEWLCRSATRPCRRSLPAST